MRTACLPFVLLLAIPGMAMADEANEAPVIRSVTGIANGTVENPLKASVAAEDPEGGPLTILWYIDGRQVCSGPNVTYYLMPGTKNVTVVVSDPEGKVTVRTWSVNGVLPPGSLDRPDNDANRAMFWGIFGSAGAILLLALAYILFMWDRDRSEGNIERKSR